MECKKTLHCVLPQEVLWGCLFSTAMLPSYRNLKSRQGVRPRRCITPLKKDSCESFFRITGGVYAQKQKSSPFRRWHVFTRIYSSWRSCKNSSRVLRFQNCHHRLGGIESRYGKNAPNSYVPHSRHSRMGISCLGGFVGTIILSSFQFSASVRSLVNYI